MKRLLVFSHAGVLDVNRAIFLELAQIGAVEITLIVPEKWKGDLITNLQFRSSEMENKIRVIPLPIAFSGNGSLYFFRKPIHESLQGWKPDLIFIDEEPWSIASWQILRSFPEAEICFYTKQNIEKSLFPPFSGFQKLVFGRSRKAFSVSDLTTEVLRWKGFDKEICYLPHSYDPRLFHEFSADEINQHRETLGIPKNRIIFSYTGRLEKEKGVEDILAALDELAVDVHNRIHFLFVGNGNLFNLVERRTRKLENVTLIPALPHNDLGKTLGLIDVLLLPSRTIPNWKEQFGRILVEAMACGTALIGSDSGEIPKLIQKSGAGFVFRELDFNQLAALICRLAIQPELISDFKQKGLSFVEQNLTHERVARKLCSDLGLTIDNKKSQPSL